jgi:hypothetical protein
MKNKIYSIIVPITFAVFFFIHSIITTCAIIFKRFSKINGKKQWLKPGDTINKGDYHWDGSPCGPDSIGCKVFCKQLIYRPITKSERTCHTRQPRK